jgi:hypothetical protein
MTPFLNGGDPLREWGGPHRPIDPIREWGVAIREWLYSCMDYNIWTTTYTLQYERLTLKNSSTLFNKNNRYCSLLSHCQLQIFSPVFVPASTGRPA